MGGSGKGFNRGRRASGKGGFHKNARHDGGRKGDRGNQRHSQHDSQGSRHDRQDHGGYDQGYGDEEEEEAFDDVEEVCRNIENLPNLPRGEREKASSKMFSSMFSSASKVEALLKQFPRDSEEMQRLQSALDAALSCFRSSEQSTITARLTPHGFEFELSGGGVARKVSLKTRAGGGVSNVLGAALRGAGVQISRREGRDIRGGRQEREFSNDAGRTEPRSEGRGAIRPVQAFGRKRGGKAAGKKKEGAAGAKKAPQPKKEGKKGKNKMRVRGGKNKDEWQEVGKGADRGKTGANLIEVNWKPAGKEDEDSDKPVVKSPSPVRTAPAGRGRGTTMPAWMTAAKASDAPPAITDGKADASSASGAGHGTAGRRDSDPPNPSIPKEDGQAVEEPDLLASFHEDRKEGDWQMPDRHGRKRGGKGKGGPKGGKGTRSRSRSGGKGGRKGRTSRSRSGGKGARKGKPSRSRSGGARRRSGGGSGSTPVRLLPSREDGRERRDEWNDSRIQKDDHKDRDSSKWERGSTSWQANSRNDSKTRQESESDSLLCSKHSKKRSWASLVAVDGEWVCRADAECIVYVGGSKDSGNRSESTLPARSIMLRSPSRSPPRSPGGSRRRSHCEEWHPVGVTAKSAGAPPPSVPRDPTPRETTSWPSTAPLPPAPPSRDAHERQDHERHNRDRHDRDRHDHRHDRDRDRRDRDRRDPHDHRDLDRRDQRERLPPARPALPASLAHGAIPVSKTEQVSKNGDESQVDQADL